MTATQDATIAELQRANANLRREREAGLAREATLAEELAARTAELATRNTEYGERIEQQTATIDVLKVMSASPGDPQPAFDLIVSRARDLCDGYGATVYGFDGALIHWRAATGVTDDPSVREAVEAMYPMAPSREWPVGRAIMDRQIIHISDLDKEPRLNPTTRAVRTMGVRSTVAIPLLRGEQAIGVIAIGSSTVGGFSDGQITLLQTFAEQAVIAITSAETYRALQTRTSDLQETLEYQTATSDVLKVISRSAFNLQPVLDTVVETAARLCDADQAAISRRDGEARRLAASFGFPPEYVAHLKGLGAIPGGPPSTGNRAWFERQPVHIHDVAAVPGYPDEAIRFGKQRTSLGVPLLREGETVGVIVLARQRVEPFTDRQIELVRTFADQAVIAIENTRLITEQREALEQQTAMAEVLQVINATPGNLAPVFDAVLERALRLCGAAFGMLGTYDGTRFRWEARLGGADRRRGVVATSEPGSALERVANGQRVVHIPDLVDTDAYRNGIPSRVALVERSGARAGLWVALRKDDTVLGVILIYRREPRAFSEKQIALLESFAAQAVIAMENARLLTEQREALEQQTATAEVLQVINSSPGNLAPVFNAILDKAHSLCGADIGSLLIFDGEHFQLASGHGHPKPIEALLRRAVRPNIFLQQLVRGEPLVHVPDFRAAAKDLDHELTRGTIEATDVRTSLWVPLRKDGVLLGCISAFRVEIRPFSDKEVALLQNFAAQAVIAMENARLINEQREALEQQAATTEVLEVINASPGDLVPVFDAMLEKALRLGECAFGILVTYDGKVLNHVAMRGVTPELAEVLREPYRPTPGQAIYRIVYGGENVVHDANILDDEAYRGGHPNRRAMADLGGARTQLLVALRKEDALRGVFCVYRQEVRPFTDKQIALLENFAAQAVIAMENARLITEQREALEQQTATAEVLQVINVSPGNLVPVFDAILEKAHRICNFDMGSLATYDGTFFRAVATRGYGDQAEVMARTPYRPLTTQRALLRGDRLIHIPDMQAYPVDPDDTAIPAFVTASGFRACLMVPLRKDGTLHGFLTGYRKVAGPFSEKQIVLLENFAAQAVIAMDNARLINEQREALEQQTATAEVLQVINASPGNLTPVFDAMLEKAMRLCEAQFGVLSTYDGERFRIVAAHGIPVAYTQGWPEGLVPVPGSALERVANGDRVVHILDLVDTDAYRQGVAWRLSLVETTGARTALWVALRKDDALLGVFVIYRQEVRAFTGKQIALLENFAAQAVIAMESARLLNELRARTVELAQRQAELRVTFDNMGDGVAMFDTDLRLTAWNRNFQRIIDLPDTLLETRPGYADYLRLLAERGEFGTTDIEAELSLRIEDTDKELRLERVRPDGRVIEVRRNAVSGGGFVLIYSDITERKRSEAEIRAARDAAETALRELRTAQANLIQAEKMASLGQLTAGIAHEIKNPLNFVNNFAALSVDLLGELTETAAPGFAALTEKQRGEVEELSVMLTSNLEKITEHGKRADGIVKAMLEHSRGSSGERRMVDLNALIDEALNLAYHGARAQDQSFNITLERDFGEGIAPIEVNPQDITRVFLNLFANGFYAVTRRACDVGDAGFDPTLKVTTRDAGEAVEIRVRDNGTGIPADIRDKLFQPFFTTKPTGEGTGLGLSITYDIVTQQHGGNIAVDSKVGEYSEFTIQLPRKP